MSTADIFSFVLILATLLCALVAGFLFAFAVVVMPGLRRLNDREYIRAFQVIDGVIQNNQPLFMLVWGGSVLALIVSAVLGFGELDGSEQVLIIVATALYLVGVQLPTIAVNVPLNNQLQSVDTEALDEAAVENARNRFEARWNQWNQMRTGVAVIVSVLLMILLRTL